MDLIRFVFDRLSAAGRPDAATRARIYEQCRAEIAARHGNVTASLDVWARDV